MEYYKGKLMRIRRPLSSSPTYLLPIYSPLEIATRQIKGIPQKDDISLLERLFKEAEYSDKYISLKKLCPLLVTPVRKAHIWEKW